MATLSLRPKLRPIARLLSRFAIARSLAIALALSPLPLGLVDRAQAQGGEKRLALVVGNASYKQFPLDNPVRDARAVSAELQKLGFEVLTFENVGGAKFRRELANFAKRAKSEDGVALFYYAGHGIGVRGRNLLVPIDAEITTEESAFAEPVDVQFHLLSELDQAKKQTNLVILDACRDDPFAQSRNDPQAKRGLVEMGAKNSLIAFATRPGEVAEDGEVGQNGMFTGALLSQMQTPGLEIRSLFTRVRADVLQRTRQRQYPYVNDLLVRDFVFRPGGASNAKAGDAEAEQRRIDAAVAALRSKQELEVKGILAELAQLRRERDEARKIADLAQEQARQAAVAVAAPVVAQTGPVVAQAAMVDSKARTVDAPSADAAGAEAARVEAARVEAARVEAARVEAARVEAARVEAARVEAARVEAARVEAARVEAARATGAARAGEAARTAEAKRVAEAARAAETARVAEAARAAETARAAEATRAAETARVAAEAEAAKRRDADDRARAQQLAAEAKAAEERYRIAQEKDRQVQLKLLRAEDSPQLTALGIAPEPAAAIVDRGDIVARGVRLPADTRIVAPPADVPAACRGFSGAWGHGRWDLKRTAEIWIEQIGRDCSVKATYARGGVSLLAEAATYERVSGKVEGGELRLPLSGGKRISMRLTREKTVRAEWTDGRDKSVAEFDPISPRPDAPTSVYALEDEHDGRAPTSTILAGNFNLPLPKQVPGATTISTLELRALLAKRSDVVLVDAISDEQHRSLPNAVWLPDIGQAAGYGSRHFMLGAKELDNIRESITKASGGDLARPIVVFERSTAYGWLGYHGALRVIGMGYTNVYWYRGGLDAWHDAGLLVASR